MIRTREFKTRYIPQRLIKPLRQEADTASEMVSWNQIPIYNDNLRLWCAKIANFNLNDIDSLSIVFHRVYGDVPTHRDCESKSCRIIPLRTGKNTKLYVDGESFYSERFLKPYNVYTFNDHNDHSLQNEPNCKCEFITVAFIKD